METRLSGTVLRDKNRRNPASPVAKRSIMLAGNKTSVSLEKSFWDGLNEIADEERITRSALIERIDTYRIDHNLSSSIRIFVLNYFRIRSAPTQEISTEGCRQTVTQT